MEFTVSKKDLVRELNLLASVVEKKNSIPILSNVLVEASDGKITLTATDLELGLQSECKANVKEAGAATVPAKRLLEYVRLLSRVMPSNQPNTLTAMSTTSASVILPRSMRWRSVKPSTNSVAIK